ncbi:MAG TPA: hypothetical protein VGM95_03060 [Lactobacillaceae bacterium]|jgi:hypothetical protein
MDKISASIAVIIGVLSLLIGFQTSKATTKKEFDDDSPVFVDEPLIFVLHWVMRPLFGNAAYKYALLLFGSLSIVVGLILIIH